MSVLDTDAQWSSTGGLTKSIWDGLARDAFYSSSSWLDFCSTDPSGTTGAACVEVSPGCYAAMPVARIYNEPFPYYRWADRYAAAGFTAVASEGLLVGPRRGYHSSILRSERLDPVVAASALISRIDGIRNSSDLSTDSPCVGMFLTTEDVLSFQEAGVPATPLVIDFEGLLRIPKGGWDEWIRSLSSKRRSLVLREVGDFERAGYRIDHTTLGNCYKTVARLLAKTQEKHGQEADIGLLTKSMMSHGQAMGDQAKVVLCSRPNEEPVGFCLYYTWGRTTYLRGTGFDYDRITNAGEYFMLCYYHQIRLAERTGIDAIHFGIKSPSAKSLRGAEIRPLWLLDLSGRPFRSDDQAQARSFNSRAIAEVSASSRSIEKNLVLDGIESLLD